MIHWENAPTPRFFSVQVLEPGDDFPSQGADDWRDRPMTERIAAVEFLRQQFFAPYDPARDRIQRVMQIIELPLY